MKILFITPFNIFPPYWGGAQRTFHLLLHLSKNHEVYLVLPSYKQFPDKRGEKYKRILRGKGIKIYEINLFSKFLKKPIIEHLNPLFLFKCVDLTFSKKIEMIICDYPWGGFYSIVTSFLTRRPLILFEHNIEFLIKKEVKAKFVSLMKLLEETLWRLADRIVVVCDKDKEFISNFGVNKRKIVVIENGFDSSRFYPSSKNVKKIRKRLKVDNSPLIFFCGKLDYPPNKEAVYLIRWNILPFLLNKLPKAKIVVVGGGYEFDIKHPSLIFTGPVDNIQDYLNAADIVIAPVLKGGGSRIKILEAIACGKLVISTKKAAENLTNSFTKNFIKIAKDWKEFTEKVALGISNKSNLKPSKEFVRRYAWKNLFKKMETILEGIKKT